MTNLISDPRVVDSIVNASYADGKVTLQGGNVPRCAVAFDGPLEFGRTYAYSMTVDSIANGNVGFLPPGGGGQFFAEAGTHTGSFVAQDDEHSKVSVRGTLGTEAVVDIESLSLEVQPE